METLNLKLTKSQNVRIEKLVKVKFEGNEEILLSELGQEVTKTIDNFIEREENEKYRLIYKNPGAEVVGMEVYPFQQDGVSLIKPIKLEVENWEEDGEKAYFLESKELGVISGGDTFDEAYEDFLEDLIFSFKHYPKAKKVTNGVKRMVKEMKKVLK